MTPFSLGVHHLGQELQLQLALTTLLQGPQDKWGVCSLNWETWPVLLFSQTAKTKNVTLYFHHTKQKNPNKHGQNLIRSIAISDNEEIYFAVVLPDAVKTQKMKQIKKHHRL